MSHYHLFLDETGDHGLSFVDPNFPLFLLCGCIFREEWLRETETAIRAFKHEFFKTDHVILHSRDIRKCELAFQILFDLELKAKFYRELNAIIDRAEFVIIGSGIDKQEHIKRYGKAARDPYGLSLSFIIERLVFYLDATDKNATVSICAERRGKAEDETLLAYYHSIIDRGTTYVSRQRLHERIRGFQFRHKRDNVIGLQLADLCAYPLARSILYPKEQYIPLDIVRKKLYANSEGKSDGWGLKVFP